jgi:uncharacterized protein (TIGR02147 family)
MNYEANYYSSKLKETLVQRQRVNSRYSLRAFSRDLGMHPATLTLVLQEKRPLPKKNVDFVVNKLEMTPSEEAIFRESLTLNKTFLDKINVSSEYMNRYILDDSQYKAIAEWEHYAVITLMETKTFESSIKYISERLNISELRTQTVLRNLEIAQLIEQNEKGEYILLKGPLRTTEDISSKALRISHKETLEMSKNKLDEVEIELRDFSSMTVAVDPKNISEAKTIIREFRKKMATLLRDGEKTEVFQLAIQLYPLTNIEKEV